MGFGKVFCEHLKEQMNRQEYTDQVLVDFFGAAYGVDVAQQCRVRPLRPPPPPPPPSLRPRPAQQPPAAKQYCPYCGRRIANDMLECPGCGAPQ